MLLVFMFPHCDGLLKLCLFDMNFSKNVVEVRMLSSVLEGLTRKEEDKGNFHILIILIILFCFLFCWVIRWVDDTINECDMRFGNWWLWENEIWLEIPIDFIFLLFLVIVNFFSSRVMYQIYLWKSENFGFTGCKWFLFSLNLPTNINQMDHVWS